MIGQPTRKLSVACKKDGSNGVLLIGRDSGIGLDGTVPNRRLEAFCATQGACHSNGPRGRSNDCRSPWRVAVGPRPTYPREIFPFILGRRQEGLVIAADVTRPRYAGCWSALGRVARAVRGAFPITIPAAFGLVS